MNDLDAASATDEAVGDLVESFLARYRRGERPILSELIERRPDLADQLLDIIPALVDLERLGAGSTGWFSGSGSLRRIPPAIDGNHPGTLDD